MRFVLFAIGLGLTLTACSMTPLESAPNGCVQGQEPCGAGCVPTGTCQPTTAAGAGGNGGQAGSGGSGDNPGMGGTAGSATVPATGGAVTATSATSGAPSSNCTDLASFHTVLTTDFAGTFVRVDGVNKQYFMQANWWGFYDQETETVDGLSFSVANPTAATSYGDMPMGYPSFFIGSYAGHSPTGSNLPKQVSALSNVYTVFSTNASSKGYTNFNAAYDVWLTSTGDPLPSYQYDPGTGGAYLMVWLFMPMNRQPRGFNMHPSQAVRGLPGTWDVWIDNSDPPCISYVSTTPLDKLDYDLNNFIQDAVANNYGVTSSMFLSIIFAGFEIWGGADGLQAKAFCANVL